MEGKGQENDLNAVETRIARHVRGVVAAVAAAGAIAHADNGMSTETQRVVLPQFVATEHAGWVEPVVVETSPTLEQIEIQRRAILLEEIELQKFGTPEEVLQWIVNNVARNHFTAEFSVVIEETMDGQVLLSHPRFGEKDEVMVGDRHTVPNAVDNVFRRTILVHTHPTSGVREIRRAAGRQLPELHSEPTDKVAFPPSIADVVGLRVRFDLNIYLALQAKVPAARIEEVVVDESGYWLMRVGEPDHKIWPQLREQLATFIATHHAYVDFRNRFPALSKNVLVKYIVMRTHGFFTSPEHIRELEAQVKASEPEDEKAKQVYYALLDALVGHAMSDFRNADEISGFDDISQLQLMVSERGTRKWIQAIIHEYAALYGISLEYYSDDPTVGVVTADDTPKAP